MVAVKVSSVTMRAGLSDTKEDASFVAGARSLVAADAGQQDRGEPGDLRREEGPEQRRRRQYGRGDRDALGDGLGRVADRVELGEDRRTVLVDVARHLRDALRVVADRTEGVHGDDDADCRQQATAGQRDREQRDDDRAAAEQERAEHGGADDDRGVDRRLEADREAGQDGPWPGR